MPAFLLEDIWLNNNKAQPDVMSSEFTIDIQLTELGFPELFQDEARAKEVPSHPCPNDSPCAPLTPPVSQTAPPPPKDLRPDSVAGVLPDASKPTKTRDCVPAHKVAAQRGQNDDQSNPVDTPHTGAGPKHREQNVSTAVRKKPEAAAGLNYVSGGGDGGGGSGRAGMGPEQDNKHPGAEAEKDSEESDDSDVSEEDVEDDDDEEEDDEEEASDASADPLAERSCRVCGLSLPSAFQLREHMHLHSGARPYRCAECGKQFCHLANYRAHLRSHAQTAAFRCRVCQAVFETADSLAHHLENSHLEKEFYQCDFCKRIFACLTECQRHVDMHQREPRRHHCSQCDRHFRRRRTLARHMEQHAAKRSYLCTDCGQAFERKNVLFRHSFSHLGLLPYTCVRCRRHFRLASLYRKHACAPQRIQCEACLGFFHSQEDFQRHKQETGCWGHQGAGQRARGDGVRCMECGQAFGSSEELRRHGSAHQRVLTCSECGKGFRSALLLMSHMGGHAGQRPCLCQRCGLGFPHQQGYDSHRKLCGRPPPDPVAAKKQKKDTPAAEKEEKEEKEEEAPPKGVWKLTLDKLVAPGLAEMATAPPASSLSVKEPRALLGSGSAQSATDSAGQAKASAGEGPTPEAACQESLPVPGTTLKLQISKATFIVGAPGAGGLFGSAVAGRPRAAKDHPSTKGRTWTIAVKEEGVEVEVGNKDGGAVAKEEETGQERGSLRAVKVEGGEAGALGPEAPKERGGAFGVPRGSLKRSDSSADEGSDAERQGARTRQGPGPGTTAEEEEEWGRVFDSVEVEIRDEEMEADQEVDGEPHECVNCGKILLEGEMVQHYMQHAMESDSPLQDCSPEIQPLSSSSPPPLCLPSCEPPKEGTETPKEALTLDIMSLVKSTVRPATVV
ncbi:hypothetical protein COCON_G00003400 [Conger conger]|uniref:C2H2-type domain-containing protein n=1 Tax=Conger conger TaxID=82655 RepID=A0A9Q1E120_CONCO|nr:hypothetical protein COCON_G00003400 [Conger conger]